MATTASASEIRSSVESKQSKWKEVLDEVIQDPQLSSIHREKLQNVSQLVEQQLSVYLEELVELREKKKVIKKLFYEAKKREDQLHQNLEVKTIKYKTKLRKLESSNQLDLYQVQNMLQNSGKQPSEQESLERSHSEGENLAEATGKTHQGQKSVEKIKSKNLTDEEFSQLMLVSANIAQNISFFESLSAAKKAERAKTISASANKESNSSQYPSDLRNSSTPTSPSWNVNPRVRREDGRWKSTSLDFVTIAEQREKREIKQSGTISKNLNKQNMEMYEKGKQKYTRYMEMLDNKNQRDFRKYVVEKYGYMNFHFRTLYVNMKDCRILHFKGKSFETSDYLDELSHTHSDRQVLKMEKSFGEPRVLKIFWVGKKSVRYVFRTAEERESFFEAVKFIQQSLNPASTGSERALALAAAVPAPPPCELNILITTWNMGDGGFPNATAMQEWLPTRVHDLYVIAVQESEPTETECIKHLHNHLGSDYLVLSAASLWAIRIFLFIRKDLDIFVTNVQTQSIPTGIGNVAGNKGAAGVSFSYKDTTLCFVSAHLAAHQDKLESRNEMFAEIMHSLELGHRKYELTDQFHHLFFIGDLNYRIDMKESAVHNLIKQSNWEELVECDQLKISQKSGKVFEGFQEGALNFPPTFKFVPGTSNYTKRIPAWCDRILWRSIPSYQDNITQTSFTSIQNPAAHTSDHMPVRATFKVQVHDHYIPEPFATQRRSVIFLSHLYVFGDKKYLEKEKSVHIRFISPVLEEETTVVLPQQNIDDNSSATLKYDAINIELQPLVSKPEFLETQLLFFSLHCGHHRLGQGVISLREAASVTKQFSTPFSSHGASVGLLMGKVMIITHKM